jgi:plasmid stabilization system protein ParE
MNIRFNADARAGIESLRRYLEPRNPLAYQRIASRIETVLTL